MDAFLNPERIYRGTDLWMLNDRLEEDELRRQIRELRDKGHHSFIARTYNGLKSDYPGEDFMRKMAVIIDEARKAGMKVALQAGYMPGAFPDLPNEYALQYLAPLPESPAHERVLYSENGVDYTLEYADFAVDMFQKKAVEYYISAAYERMWMRFADEFGRTVFSVWLDEPRYDPKRLPWTRELPRLFREAWGYDLVPMLPLLYEDTGDCKQVRYHYFTLLQKLMGEHYFKPVRDWCHAHRLLFSGHLMSEDYLKNQISNACANMPYYKYFDIPGIDALTVQQNWVQEPALHPNPLHAEHIDYNTPIQCVSAAHQAGKAHILCEMYGVTSSNLTFRAQKQLFDHFAALGVNHRCAHAIFYSLAGFRKRFYPHHLNDYQPYWPKAGMMTDYIARVSHFISQGQPVGETLVLHPLETAYGLYRGLRGDTEENQPIDRYDKRFHRLLMDLLSNHRPFELADMATFAGDGEAPADGGLRIGSMRYRSLVLPEIEVLSSGALRLIERFCGRGGRMIVLGKAPSRLDGYESGAIAEAFAGWPNVAYAANSAEVVRLLEDAGGGYALESGKDISGVLVHQRIDGEKRYFFLHNRDCSERKRLELVLPGARTAELWHAEDGTKEEAIAHRRGDATVVTLELEAGGSAMVCVQDGEPPETAPVPRRTICLPLRDAWRMQPQEKNLLTLEYCQYQAGDAPFTQEYTVQCAEMILRGAQYEGELKLRFAFQAACDLKALQLVLEEPELCEITLNGVPVDPTPKGHFFAKAFAVIDLPDAVKEGRNVLEIRRHYQPAKKEKSHLLELFRAPKGVDLEPVHLLGRFVVEALPELTFSGERRYHRSFLMRKEPAILETGGDVTASGFPFYAGEMRLSQRVTMDEEALACDEIALRLGVCKACAAEVWVNGIPCGDTAWAPYRVRIKHALKAGDNEIELRLFNTLRNMMGPSHRTAGECPNSSPASWLCDRSEYELLDGDTNARTDSFLLAGYGVDEAALECR